MPVIDTSPNHDWTSVAVMELRSGKYGRDNPSFGFVYPGTGPREEISFSQPGLVRFAVASEYLDGNAAASGERNRYLHRVRAQWTGRTQRGQTAFSAD
jgi:hypothetical protein